MVIRHPPARTAPEWRIRARVRLGVEGGRGDYRIKAPISKPNISLSVKCPDYGWNKPLSHSHPVLLQLAALLSVSLCRDPRRLISRAPDLSLLALSWRTMAPFLCPEALWTGVCPLLLTTPDVVPPFFCQQQQQQPQLFSPVPCLDGKLSGCVTVSALLCGLTTLTDDRGEEVALKTAKSSRTHTRTGVNK